MAVLGLHGIIHLNDMGQDGGVMYSYDGTLLSRQKEAAVVTSCLVELRA